MEHNKKIDAEPIKSCHIRLFLLKGTYTLKFVLNQIFWIWIFMLYSEQRQ